jgi:hypothetical protein
MAGLVVQEGVEADEVAFAEQLFQGNEGHVVRFGKLDVPDHVDGVVTDACPGDDPHLGGGLENPGRERVARDDDSVHPPEEVDQFVLAAGSEERLVDGFTTFRPESPIDLATGMEKN